MVTHINFINFIILYFVVGFIIIIVDWTVWLWLKASTNLDPEVVWSDSGSAYNDGDSRNVSYLAASGTIAYRSDSVDDWNSRPPHLVRDINQILTLKITISFKKSDIKIIACKFHLELCQLAICFCGYLLIYPRIQGWFNHKQGILPNEPCATSSGSDQPAHTQSRCKSLAYSMTVKLLTEHHLVNLSLKRGYTGSSESTHVKIPQC